MVFRPPFGQSVCWLLAQTLVLHTSLASATVQIRFLFTSNYKIINLGEVRAYDASGNFISATGATFTHGNHECCPGSYCLDGVLATTCAANNNYGAGHAFIVSYPPGSQIARINVTNRADCCQERSAGLTIRLEEQGAVVWEGKTAGSQPYYEFGWDVQVRVAIQQAKRLVLQEVMAFAWGPDGPPPAGPPIQLVKKSAVMRDDEDPTYPASNCIDGEAWASNESSRSDHTRCESVGAAAGNYLLVTLDTFATNYDVDGLVVMNNHPDNGGGDLVGATVTLERNLKPYWTTTIPDAQVFYQHILRQITSTATTTVAMSTTTMMSTAAETTSVLASTVAAEVTSTVPDTTTTAQTTRALVTTAAAEVANQGTSASSITTEAAKPSATSSQERPVSSTLLGVESRAATTSTVVLPDSPVTSTTATTVAGVSATGVAQATASASAGTTGVAGWLATSTNAIEEPRLPESSTTFASQQPATTAASTSSSIAGQDASRGAQLAGMSTVQLLKPGVPSVVAETELGTVYAFDLNASLGSGASVALPGGEGSKVTVTRALLEALPTGASISMLNMAPNSSSSSAETFDDVAERTGQTLASPATDISVYDAAGNYVPVTLPSPLLFRLPDGPGTDTGRAVCRFFDVQAARPHWSDRGVWRADPGEVTAAGFNATGVWCKTLHLSIFAALVESLVLGCTNLELLTEDAMRAVVDNEGWYKANSAIIVFVIACLLLLLFIIGILWEHWSFRLGKTHEDVKENVYCCGKFFTVGVQLMKHKYTAFLVYARDLLNCLRTGRHKLRLSSLTNGVQRFLAVRTGISTACIAQHCWNGGAWAETKASIPHTVLCRKLEFHSGAVDEVIRDLCGFGPLQSFRRFFYTFIGVHPLLDAMRLGPGSMTVGKRMVLQASTLFGVLATNSLIFNFSGSFRSWEAPVDCFIDPASQFFLLVATVVSVGVNAVPNTVLLDVAKQIHGRPIWNAVFWFSTILYLLMAGLLITIALANLNPKDQGKWYAALEWAMTIKLIGMPTAQALRHWILLEVFLYEDSRNEISKQFRVVMGLKHHNEQEISEEEQALVNSWATKAISTSELVKFYALLGEEVMPDFDPETSTSEDVMERAIFPLTAESPNRLQEMIVEVQVLELSGLELPSSEPLSCSVLHLAKRVKQERPCIQEQQSQAAEATLTGGVGSCSWLFKARVPGLEPEHALGFTVMQQGQPLGIACLSADEVFQGGKIQWSGDLTVHPTTLEPSTSSFSMPPETSLVPSPLISGSGGPIASPRDSFSRMARLTVKVLMPPGYLQAVASVQRSRTNLDTVEPEDTAEVSEPTDWRPVTTQTSTMTVTKSHSYVHGGIFPPDRMVVHSRQGKFLHLITTVLTDAMGLPGSYKEVEDMLRARSFQDVVVMLRKQRCDRTRYWIDLFAIDPRGLQLESTLDTVWHAKYLACLPSLLRSLRKAACKKNVADMYAKKEAMVGPLVQLLILDKNFHFMHESSCLSEMMLAKAMAVLQRLVLHPSHLEGKGLGEELKRFAIELADADAHQELQHTVPYLEERQAVYDVFRELAIKGVKEHKLDHRSSWEELGMADLVTTLAAVEAAREREMQQHGGGMDDFADADAGCAGD